MRGSLEDLVWAFCSALKHNCLFLWEKLGYEIPALALAWFLLLNSIDYYWDCSTFKVELGLIWLHPEVWFCCLKPTLTMTSSCELNVFCRTNRPTGICSSLPCLGFSCPVLLKINNWIEKSVLGFDMCTEPCRVHHQKAACCVFEWFWGIWHHCMPGCVVL